MLFTTILPSICFYLTVVFPVMFPMNFRNISVVFPVVFPPYITMVWYLFLVKGGIIQVLWLFWMVRWSLRLSNTMDYVLFRKDLRWLWLGLLLVEVKQSTLSCKMPDFTCSRYIYCQLISSAGWGWTGSLWIVGQGKLQWLLLIYMHWEEATQNYSRIKIIWTMDW